MKTIKFLLVALFVSLLFAPVVLAQDGDVKLDTGSAVGLIQSLFDNKDAIILMIVGVLSSQLIKYGKSFSWLGDLTEPLRKTVVYGASLILPVLFSTGYTALMPVAKYVDNAGYWPVIIAVFGLIYGGQYVSYAVERVPQLFSAALAARSLR